MAYIEKGRGLVITDAADYSVDEAKALIAEFRKNNPGETGFSLRSDRHLLDEWALHALCYRMGIMRSRARDAFLQFKMEPEVRIMYAVLGPLAILILRLF